MFSKGSSPYRLDPFSGVVVPRCSAQPASLGRTSKVPHSISAATIAILGVDTVAEHVLAMLLENEGYTARLIKAPPTAAPTVLLPEAEGDSVEELLDGVDVVLLWPPAQTQRDAAREAFVGAMRSAAATAKIPVLALSPSLAVAAKDELAGEAPLMRQFEQLLWIIREVLGSPAGSVAYLDLGGLPSQPDTFA
jgi:hypothetical protein